MIDQYSYRLITTFFLYTVTTFIIVRSKRYLLILLLCLELLFLSLLFFSIVVYFLNINFSRFFLTILILSACDACIGLCLLVIHISTLGHRLLHNHILLYC